MNYLTILREHLGQPEYMHVLINPMPVYGLSMGVITLGIALIARSRSIMIAALILIFIAGLSAWPTYHYGQAAYDRVKSMSDAVGGQWLDEHMARAEKLIYAFYLLAAVALTGIFAPLRWPRSSVPLAITTLVLGVTTLGIGGWIAYPAGHIRHKEFRFEAPPAAQADEHTHTHLHHPEENSMHDEHAEGEGAKPMDNSSMPGMGANKDDATLAPDPLEASRLQLEASRLQLEASRKQLEATKAAEPSAVSPSPNERHDHEHRP